MASYEYELVAPPDSERGHELWLQHAAGFVLFEDVRRYAMEEIDPKLAPEARDAVLKGINDAVYGLMMVLDGVTGGLSNATDRVQLKVVAQHVQVGDDEDDTVVSEIELMEGDGMCMGYHGWLEGDYGSDPVAKPSSE